MEQLLHSPRRLNVSGIAGIALGGRYQVKLSVLPHGYEQRLYLAQALSKSLRFAQHQDLHGHYGGVTSDRMA